MMRLSFFISLCISLFGVLIVQHLFSSDADNVNQSKYLGFIGITFVTPFILLSIFVTYRYFLSVIKNIRERLMRLVVILICISLLVFLGYFSYKYKMQIVQDTDSYFPPLNEKTYQVYFNFYTFSFVHTVSALCGSVQGIINKEMIKDHSS